MKEEYTGIVRDIQKEKFQKDIKGCKLKLKTSDGIKEVDFPDYCPGLTDKKNLRGAKVKYIYKSDTYEGIMSDHLFLCKKYNLKVITGELKGEKLETELFL